MIHPPSAESFYIVLNLSVLIGSKDVKNINKKNGINSLAGASNPDKKRLQSLLEI